MRPLGPSHSHQEKHRSQNGEFSLDAATLRVQRQEGARDQFSWNTEAMPDFPWGKMLTEVLVLECFEAFFGF